MYTHFIIVLSAIQRCNTKTIISFIPNNKKLPWSIKNNHSQQGLFIQASHKKQHHLSNPYKNPICQEPRRPTPSTTALDEAKEVVAETASPTASFTKWSALEATPRLSLSEKAVRIATAPLIIPAEEQRPLTRRHDKKKSMLFPKSPTRGLGQGNRDVRSARLVNWYT